MKNGRLDNAICPHCGHISTRQAMYERISRDYCYDCPRCDYEYGAAPFRPLTIAEMLRGRKAGGDYRNVDLTRYTAVLVGMLAERHTDVACRRPILGSGLRERYETHNVSGQTTQGTL